MNSDKRDAAGTGSPDSIGDHNVERLITKSYAPEGVRGEFAHEVKTQLLLEAARRREETTPPASGDNSPDFGALRWGMGVVLAVAVLIMLGIAISRHAPPQVYLDGQSLWYKNQVYVPAPEKSPTAREAPSLKTLVNKKRFAPIQSVGLYGMTAGRRETPSTSEKLRVGQKVETKSKQRKRLQLPDGSILYMNRNSSVSVADDRHLVLHSGQIYLEVLSKGGLSKNGEAHPDFVVQTPEREVVALGTKFAVQVVPKNTEILVTQGTVQVSGIPTPLLSGEKLNVPRPSVSTSPPVASRAPRSSQALWWTRDLMVAAEVPLVPRSEHAGGALLAVDTQGQQTKLSLRKYHVDVHVEDGFARTTIDQTYFNHQAARIEGVFYFPLPPDASISRLAMYVGGKLMEGGMVERDHGRNVFETIKYRSLDPALLEWVDGTTFKMRVFPLEGRQEKRIVLSYTQKLGSHYGRSQYRFPAGHNLQVVRDWSVRAFVKGGVNMDWHCDSHDMKVETENEDLSLTSSAKDVRFDRDVVLDLYEGRSPVKPTEERAQFSAVDHDGSRYLMLRFRPGLPAKAKRQRRDWLFLFEADGSRNPLLARVQIDVLRTLLEHAEHDDTFSIVTAGTRLHSFSSQPQKVSPESIQKAIQFLESTHLIGALNLEAALEEVDKLAKLTSAPCLVHLGAGIPVMGRREDAQLLQQLSKKTPYVGVAVGKRWNRTWMKAAAEKTGGYFTQISPDEPTTWRAMEVASAINAPRLLGVRITDESSRLDFLLHQDGALQGEELYAISKFGADDELPSSVFVRGRLNGVAYERRLELDNVQKDARALPRFWTKLAIDKMVAENEEQNKAKIIALSKSMYVMSPFTSLIVLENDEMYKVFKVDRGRKDHWAMYPCPLQIEVVREAGPAIPTDTPPPSTSRPTKPTPTVVLRTVVLNGSGRYVLQAPRVTLWNGGQHYVTSHNYAGVAGPGPGILYSADMMRLVTPRILHQVEDKFSSVNFSLMDPLLVSSDFDGDQLMDRRYVVFTNMHDTDGRVVLASGLRLDQRHSTSALVLLGDGATVEDLLFDVPPRAAWVDLGPSDYKENWAQWGRRPWRSLPTFDRPTAGREVADREVAAKLGATVDLHVDKSPFAAVMKELLSKNNVPFQLDVAALKRAKISQNAPVTLHVNNVSLHAALTLLSHQLNLIYTVNGGQIRITTLRAMSRQVAERDRMSDEFLSLFAPLDPWTRQMSSLPGARLMENRWQYPKVLAKRLSKLQQRLHVEQTEMRYSPPPPNRDHVLFDDLLSYASGLITTRADLSVVLELESNAGRPANGNIDARARHLINSARKSSWKQISLDSRPSQQFRLDGAGRFRFERRTLHGLREIIICDGREMRHLYPELGLATKRQMSRFHRAWLSSLVPWFVAPVEDLAVGHDIRPIAEHTVAVVPREAKQEGSDSQRRAVRMHLKFDPSGRLIERELLDAHSRESLRRFTFDADGTVRIFDGDGRLHAECQFDVRESSPPDLTPSVNDLVVLPMPMRSQEHVTQSAAQAKSAAGSGQKEGVLENIATADKVRQSADPANWTEDNALRLALACYRQNPSRMQEIIGSRFFARGDRRIGFYTLLLSSQISWTPDQPVSLPDGSTVRMNPVDDHPEAALAHYVVQRLRQRVAQSPDDNTASTPANLPQVENNEFISALVQFRALLEKWSHGDGPPVDAETRRSELAEVFRFVHDTVSTRAAYVLLRKVQRRFGNSQPHGRLAEAILKTEERGPICFEVKYELARSLRASGQKATARKLFLELYEQALRAGVIPPIDRDFVTAVSGAKIVLPADSLVTEEISRTGLAAVMHGACRYLVQHDQAIRAVNLAWQCRQLNEPELARRLIDQILDRKSDTRRSEVTLAVVEYLSQTDDPAGAHSLLEPFLSKPQFSSLPALWRLAHQIANDASIHARSVYYLERAVELECRDLPNPYELSTIRAKFQELLSAYSELAQVVAAPDIDSPLNLATRVVQAADRWRSLDQDPTAACAEAARVLRLLGHQEMAWDYLTTPLALRPNESKPWLELAESLKARDELSLAELAYREAFTAEATNPQILWSHAEMLENHGRLEGALTLYHQISTGVWQPRFANTKTRASKREKQLRSSLHE